MLVDNKLHNDEKANRVAEVAVKGKGKGHGGKNKPPSKTNVYRVTPGDCEYAYPGLEMRQVKIRKVDDLDEEYWGS